MRKQLAAYVSRKIGNFRTFLDEAPDAFTRQFADHNRSVWRGYRPDTSQGEVLIEANNIGSCNVGMTYVASYLGRALKSRLIVYCYAMSRSNRLMYRSFADAILRYAPARHSAEVEKLFLEVFPQIKTKRDLEELRVQGVWIGDLVYDTYIRRLEVATVDLRSPELAGFLKDALGYLLHWRAYFDVHRVRAVLVSHCVYSWSGIIARVAIAHAVPVYLVQPNKLYYVAEGHNGRAYNEYVDYPRDFARLSAAARVDALARAQERLARRFRGERDVGLHHLLRLNYTGKTGRRVLADGSRPRVLVAAHCFSDDNHVYGNNLFPDFYEWLVFLGEMSERTDYDWYLKLHPDRYAWETRHIEDFAARFTRFTVLPAETSHNQIIDDGVNCVLTVYGTIGFEYAAHGVPVVTAALWNPTVAYDFNVHPKTVAEYEHVLLHLADLRVQVDLDKVAEYYYSHYMNEPDGWLYESFQRLDEELGGGRAHLGSLSYRKFMDQHLGDRHRQILGTVQNFIESAEYCLRPHHFAVRGNRA